MAVLIFREQEIEKLEKGWISARDVGELDRRLDKRLIDYLIRKAPERYSKGAMRKYGVKEMPEPVVNPRYPEDDRYEIYLVLEEQVKRENDCEVLRKAAYSSYDYDIPRFAFSRLTGYSWPEFDLDESWYLTYKCGLKSDVLREDIEDFCREMIKNDGPFRREARAYLRYLPEISDEELDEMASEKTERSEYRRPLETIRNLMQPADGAETLSERELYQKIRGLADAYYLMIYEKKFGPVPRRERLLNTDRFIRMVNDADNALSKDMLEDVTYAVTAGLRTSHLMPEDLTREKILEIVRTESDDNPHHGYFLELAGKLGLEEGTK